MRRKRTSSDSTAVNPPTRTLNRPDQNRPVKMSEKITPVEIRKRYRWTKIYNPGPW